MGRFQAMPASTDAPTSDSPQRRPAAAADTAPRRPPKKTAASRRVARARIAEDDPSRLQPSQRLAALEAYQPRGCTFQPELVTAVAGVVGQTDMVSHSGDTTLMGEGCRLAHFDQVGHGGNLDIQRAFLPANVDYYLRQITPAHTQGGLKSLQSRLYQLGRLVHPLAYPELRAKAHRPKTVQGPESLEKVQRIYRFAQHTSPRLSLKCYTLLDLTTGAGARADEMPRLLARDVTRAETDPRVAVVTLTSTTTRRTREVPVMDRGKSERLFALAASASSPTAPLIPMRGRNGISRVQEAVKKKQSGLSVSAVRLRYFWIVDLMNRAVPTALVLQLADLNDSHTLAGLKPWIRNFHPDAAIDALKEAS